MTTEEIKAGNRSIHEFMDIPWKFPSVRFATGRTYTEKKLWSFHTDWSILMNVIIKLSEQHLGWPADDVYHKFDDCLYPRTFGMRDENGHYMFRFNNHQLFTHESLITAAWMAVVDCINSLPKTEK